MSDRIDNIVRHGVVTRVYDAGDVMRLDVTGRDNEVFTGVPYNQPRGLSSSPVIGDLVMLVCEGGDTESAEAWCVLDKTNRPRGLGGGEVALFNQGRTGFVLIGRDGRILLLSGAPGSYQAAVILRPNGDIVLSGASITLDAPKILIAGQEIEANGRDVSISAANAQINANATAVSGGELQLNSFNTAVTGATFAVQSPIAQSTLPPISWPPPTVVTVPSLPKVPSQAQPPSEKDIQ